MKSLTGLSDFPFTFHFHALEKEMATHSSDLVWRIPGTGEPGGLPSMGSHRVGHDWSDLAAAAAEACNNLLALFSGGLLVGTWYSKLNSVSILGNTSTHLLSFKLFLKNVLIVYLTFWKYNLWNVESVRDAVWRYSLIFYERFESLGFDSISS